MEQRDPVKNANRYFWASVVIAIIPILVAAIRAPLHGWLPVSDNGLVTVRAADVFTGHPPLLGLYSSASDWSHVDFNLPGPLEFQLLAVPVRVLGPIWGATIGMALVHIAAIVASALLVRRRGGPLLAMIAMLFVVSLEWAIGSELLYDPWPINSAPFIFVLFVLAAWSVADGDLIALPVLGVAGSYLFQTHLSYVILVPALMVAGLAGLAIVMWRRRRAEPRDWSVARQKVTFWLGVSFALVVFVWIPPIVQQFTGDPGNFSQLLKAAGKSPPFHPTATNATNVFASTVALPPWWFPPSYNHPRFNLAGDGPPLALSILVIGLLVVGGVVLARRALRQRDRASFTLLAVAAVTLVAGWLTVFKTASLYGFLPTYMRWLWCVAMLSWFALTAAFLRTVTPSALVRRARQLTVGTLLVTIVVAALAIVPADRGAFPQRGAPVTRALVAQSRTRLAGMGPVLLQAPTGFGVNAEVAGALMVELQRRGIDFVFYDKGYVHQLGDQRAWNGHNARNVLRIDGDKDPQPGFERIASYYGLTQAEQAELARLTDEVRARLTASGPPRLNAFGESVAQATPLVARAWAEVAALGNNADALMSSQTFRDLVKQRYTHDGHRDYIVDVPSMDARDLRRWIELQDRSESERIALDVAPAPGAS